MDFRNKYLKYKPEITFDIFEKIWNKLVADGWNPAFADKKAEYNYFSTDHIYLQQETINSDLFGAHTLSCRLSETTVQEILGYNPFVRDDDFVLPEKWYVSVTNETVKDINIFKSKTGWKDKAIDYKAVGYEGVGYNSPPNDYTEITFDQFKKYVLKQDVEESKEVIPEYVECVSWFGNSFTPSKIYKVVNGKVKDNDGYHKITDWNHVDFKPSSKSAFDAQNQPKQLSEQTANNLSETIDRVRYRAMQTAQTETLDEMFCASIDEVSKSLDNYTNKNKIQISTDNEIKINITQKQSIKI